MAGCGKSSGRINDFIALSSNGRTQDSGSCYHGSSPCGAANQAPTLANYAAFDIITKKTLTKVLLCVYIVVNKEVRELLYNLGS